MNRYKPPRKYYWAVVLSVLLLITQITHADSDVRHLLIEAQENEASALLDEMLTIETILDNLQVLLDHIRLRQKDDNGLYPPLPEELGILSVDTTTVESSVIAKIITERICKLRDNERREQALSTLNPLIFPSIAGKIQGISTCNTIKITCDYVSDFADNRMCLFEGTILILRFFN